MQKEEIYNNLRILRRNIKYLYNLRSQLILKKLKYYQFNNFIQLKKDFIDYYCQLKENNYDKYIIPMWRNFINNLEKRLFPEIKFSFLGLPEIMITMFPLSRRNYLKTELNYLEYKLKYNELKDLLIEDYVGEPIISNSKYLTSYNTIHHLYHLLKFEDNIKCNFDEIETIIEWGGGYGNFAKIFLRKVKRKKTYIIIDIPLFSCLQWIYLSTILGRENINMIDKTNYKLINNKINLLPICFLEHINLTGDLFISTWALSESSKIAQDYVFNNKWFGSSHLLLAYQKNTKDILYASRIEKYAQQSGAMILGIPGLRENYYAFK